MEQIKVFTAFSGYDSQCLALERLKRDYPDFGYELVGWSEIDKYAIQAHNALFPDWAERNYGDISKIDWQNVPDFDLFTYSSPCQDFSNAGLQRGGEEGSGTRSSLLWECRKAIIAKRPKYLMLENVKALISKKFLPLLNKWIKDLEDYGYYNTWQVLNAKDYGVPQNRERVFLISIRRDLLDPSPLYHFPKPFKLEKRLKDVLEENVDEKYYLSDKLVESLSRDNKGFKAMKPSTPPHTGVASCLTARMHKMGRSDNYIMETNIPICLNSKVDGKQPSVPDRIYSIEGCAVAITSGWLQNIAEPQVMQVGNIVDDTNIGFKNPQRGRIYSDERLAPCLNCCEGGGLEPKIVEDWQTVVGNKQLNPFRGSVEGTSPCITSACGAGGGMTPMLTDADLETTKTKEFIEQVRGHEEMRYRIRKLTPRECFRLMGVDDADIDKIQAAGISNSQQYKMAGNSIVVDTLYHLMRKLFVETDCEEKQYQQTLF